LDPMLAERREREATRLANQGIRLGATAYDRAISLVDQGENDAYNELILRGRGQAVQERMAERAAPINEITALLSGSQVSQPNFINSNMPTIPTTDVASLINENYNQKLGIWDRQQKSVGGLISGLGGLFGTI